MVFTNSLKWDVRQNQMNKNDRLMDMINEIYEGKIINPKEKVGTM
jgi:hypothetical protein